MIFQAPADLIAVVIWFQTVFHKYIIVGKWVKWPLVSSGKDHSLVFCCNDATSLLLDSERSTIIKLWKYTQRELKSKIVILKFLCEKHKMYTHRRICRLVLCIPTHFWQSICLKFCTFQCHVMWEAYNKKTAPCELRSNLLVQFRYINSVQYFFLFANSSQNLELIGNTHNSMIVSCKRWIAIIQQVEFVGCINREILVEEVGCADFCVFH